MATKDGFDPDDPLPLFLSADEPEAAIGRDRAVISLRFVMASILFATATVIGISILSVRNPVTLFADVTASVDASAPQLGTNESIPSIQSAVQSSADAEAQQTTKDTPTREVSGDSEPTSQTPAEKSEASEALFRDFQAWNARQDARNLAKPVRVELASVTETAPEPVPPVQKQRRARTMRNAGTDITRVQKRQANTRRQNERARARPVQDARAQTQPVQSAEPPSLLERLNPFGASPLR
jgi:hypothetical protein